MTTHPTAPPMQPHGMTMRAWCAWCGWCQNFVALPHNHETNRGGIEQAPAPADPDAPRADTDGPARVLNEDEIAELLGGPVSPSPAPAQGEHGYLMLPRYSDGVQVIVRVPNGELPDGRWVIRPAKEGLSARLRYLAGRQRLGGPSMLGDEFEAAANEIDRLTAPTAGERVWVTRAQLRELIDAAWNEATESETVPSTSWADKIIDRALLAGRGEP